MTIAEVGRQFELTPDTLRYYERIGLIAPVHRTESGIRDYEQTDINWVEFIKCMRDAGVSIETLAEYVSLFQQGDNTAGARKALLVEQRAQLAARIEAMQAVLARLDKKIEGYEKLMFACESKLTRRE